MRFGVGQPVAGIVGEFAAIGAETWLDDPVGNERADDGEQDA